MVRELHWTVFIQHSNFQLFVCNHILIYFLIFIPFLSTFLDQFHLILKNEFPFETLLQVKWRLSGDRFIHYLTREYSKIIIIKCTSIWSSLQTRQAVVPDMNKSRDQLVMEPNNWRRLPTPSPDHSYRRRLLIGCSGSIAYCCYVSSERGRRPLGE